MWDASAQKLRKTAKGDESGRERERDREYYGEIHVYEGVFECDVVRDVTGVAIDSSRLSLLVFMKQKACV